MRLIAYTTTRKKLQHVETYIDRFLVDIDTDIIEHFDTTPRKVEYKPDDNTVGFLVGEVDVREVNLLDVAKDWDAFVVFSLNDVEPGMVEEVAKSGTDIHVVRLGVTIRGQFELAGTVAEAVEKQILAKRNLNDLGEYRGGRPPLGTEADEGRLVPGENFERVCRVLQQYSDGRRTAENAANQLGCTAKTVAKAAGRKELYDIE